MGLVTDEARRSSRLEFWRALGRQHIDPVQEVLTVALLGSGPVARLAEFSCIFVTGSDTKLLAQNSIKSVAVSSGTRRMNS